MAYRAWDPGSRSLFGRCSRMSGRILRLTNISSLFSSAFSLFFEGFFRGPDIRTIRNSSNALGSAGCLRSRVTGRACVWVGQTSPVGERKCKVVVRRAGRGRRARQGLMQRRSAERPWKAEGVRAQGPWRDPRLGAGIANAPMPATSWTMAVDASCICGGSGRQRSPARAPGQALGPPVAPASAFG